MIAQNALEEATAHLGAALMQTIASDDQIILDHVKAAHAILQVVSRTQRAMSVPAQGVGYPAENYAKVALGNAIEVGRLEILVARMERAVKAANAYYGCYVQDEAEEVECCVSTEQHEAAKEMRDSLRIAVTALQDRAGK